MCESNIYMRKDGEEEKILEDVEILKPEGDIIFLANVYGVQKRVKARLVSINFAEHKVILTED